MIILQNNFYLFQTKRFLDVHLNDHLFSKIHVSFMGDEFLLSCGPDEMVV